MAPPPHNAPPYQQNTAGLGWNPRAYTHEALRDPCSSPPCPPTAQLDAFQESLVDALGRKREQALKLLQDLRSGDGVSANGSRVKGLPTLWREAINNETARWAVTNANHRSSTLNSQ